MSDQDDLRVTPYLPDESLDGSLGQASADAPQFVGPSDSPAAPPSAAPPAVTPESFVLAPFPTWQDPRPFPSSAKNNLGLFAMICGIASVVVLFGGASVAAQYLDSEDIMTLALAGLAWLGLWFVTSVAAIVIAVFGLQAARQRLATNRGMSLVGLIIGVMMLVVVPLLVLFAG